MSALTTVPPSRRSRADRPALAVHHDPEGDDREPAPEPPKAQGDPTFSVAPPDVPTLDAAAIVAAVVNDGSAAVPLATVAAGLGVDVDAAWIVADDAVAAGWLVTWDRPADKPDAPPVPCLCLTPLMAERAGLRLDPTGERWEPIGTRSKVDPDPWRTKRGREVFVNLATDFEAAARVTPDEPIGAAALEVVARDYRELEPWDAADAILAAERIAAINAARKAAHEAGGPRLPRLDEGPRIPRLILGLGIPWPPHWEAGEPCPGCGGRRMSALAYCAVCDASAADARTDADAARHAAAITTPPGPALVASCGTDDPGTPIGASPAVDAPDGLLGGLGGERTLNVQPDPMGRKTSHRAKPERKTFRPPAAVTVKLLRPIGRHDAGDVIELRPSIAQAYQAVGAAIMVAGQ